MINDTRSTKEYSGENRKPPVQSQQRNAIHNHDVIVSIISYTYYAKGYFTYCTYQKKS